MERTFEIELRVDRKFNYVFFVFFYLRDEIFLYDKCDRQQAKRWKSSSKEGFFHKKIDKKNEKMRMTSAGRMLVVLLKIIK